MKKGYVMLVLHAHMPYVHHPESEDYIEERWLYEAITESYLPLLHVFERLSRDQVPFQITMSLTPTLLTLLNSPNVQDRYLQYINNLIQLAESEVKRTKGQDRLDLLSNMYLHKFHSIKQSFIEQYDRNILQGFRKFQDTGQLELITSAATHAFLPYIKTDQALRAQIENGIAIHTDLLGKKPEGIWLPECGYTEALDPILSDYRLSYFFTDTHSLLHAYPKPPHGIHAPIVTHEGVAAFARDQKASKQVWSAQEGYPGDYDYREYYRDIGYDLDFSYIQSFLHPSGIRLNTGVKYYRITGKTNYKELYHENWALNKALIHANDFVHRQKVQMKQLSAVMDRNPLIVASYDAELFGHWWYEGPSWIENVCRIIAQEQTLSLITPTPYLKELPLNPACQLSLSSWGRGGYGDVWLNENNHWMYKRLHRMEEQMIDIADRYLYSSDLEQRALNQAVRELLLAQSSDWAFIVDGQTTVEYATKRFHVHESRFYQIADHLDRKTLGEVWLNELTRMDAIAPRADYRIFQSKQTESIPHTRSTVAKTKKPRSVLMLSWEFPPLVVGGLSRHVYDLSRKLVEQGMEVHVLTSHVNGYPDYESNQGIHVHRIPTYQANELSFLDWVFQLNLLMVNYATNLLKTVGSFDILHAHDWLVVYAAKALKHQYKIPLVATIHATEHGRNQGIYSKLQQAIHQLEWQLTYEAWRVISCSHYMKNECIRLFELPSDKTVIIPNGVDPQMIGIQQIDPTVKRRFAQDEEKLILFVGRLVIEKGVQVLLESLPAVLQQVAEAKIIIIGKGPFLEELKQQVKQLSLEHKVVFTGFIDDETRNQLLHQANAAVFPSLYEPFGIVALEAMAAGLPVIVSNTGGLGETIHHGEDGFLVEPGDSYSLSQSIIRILQDPQLSAKMAQHAKQKASQAYNWEQIARQTMDLYEEE